jgi:hypothetical protein
MAIGFFLMVGTAEMLSLALRLQARARASLEATDLLRIRLESLRAETGSAQPGSPPAPADGEETVTGRDGRAFTIAWSRTPAPAPLVLVEVRVHQEGRPERELSIPIFLHPWLGF